MNNCGHKGHKDGVAFVTLGVAGVGMLVLGIYIGITRDPEAGALRAILGSVSIQLARLLR